MENMDNVYEGFGVIRECKTKEGITFSDWRSHFKCYIPFLDLESVMPQLEEAITKLQNEQKEV